MKSGAVENEGEAVCLKSWGVGPRERSLCPCWRRLQLWKRSTCLPRGAVKASPAANRHWGHFYLENGAPLLSWIPSTLTPGFLSPQASLSILTSFILSAVPFKCLPLHGQLSHRGPG